MWVQNVIFVNLKSIHFKTRKLLTINTEDQMEFWTLETAAEKTIYVLELLICVSSLTTIQ